jgi:ABC-type sugar transport system ATPase subunit
VTIAVKGLTKSYGHGAPAALDGLDLQVGPGELMVVVGPSGSGKSTLLRCIAGLEELDEGTVSIGGKDVTVSHPRDRDVAMVFQEHALYPHLDVRTNIAFPLLARKQPSDQVDKKVSVIAEALGLAGLLERRPGELSGGERRRVALARAAVRQPAAFLMDEPLSNLDTNLKLRVLDEIRGLRDSTGTTMLYVTHDQAEAMSLAHKLAVLRAGRLEQVGPPLEIYDSPVNEFVASFIGRTPMNLVPGNWVGMDAVTVGIRPEHCSLQEPAGARLEGLVVGVDQLGAEALVEVEVNGKRLLARADREAAPSPGVGVGLSWDDRHLHRFDAEGVALG